MRVSGSTGRRVNPSEAVHPNGIYVIIDCSLLCPVPYGSCASTVRGGDGQPLAGDLERGRRDVVTEMGVDDALERLGSSRFDCVVSTYRLPDGNGLEFLRSVREDHPRLPFVLVTDEGSEAVASEAIEAGVIDYRDALLDEPTPFVERVTDTVAEYRGARDAAERLQVHEAIVETVSILLYTADESATVTGVRGRASDNAGIDPDAAVGRAVSDLFDGNPAVVDGYETALDGGETAAEVEIGERAFQAWVRPLGAATDDTSGAVAPRTMPRTQRGPG